MFALTQVTAVMSEDLTWGGIGRGMLLLGLLWWAWAAYAWLTNTLDPDEGIVRVAMFAAMAAMLVVALAVPTAFGDDGVLFAGAYFLVRLAHLWLYLLASRGQPRLTRLLWQITPGTLIGCVLLLVAGTQDGATQTVLWCVALAVDLLIPRIGGVKGWGVSPGHFAERHALIVIIALGESIVAVGVGAAGLPLEAGVVAAAVAGIAVAAALWWAYFDVVALVAERRLRSAEGEAQLTMARDSYSYLHLPMVAGIVLLALGVKKTLVDVDHELKLVAAAGLYGGPALYLLAHVAFRLRNIGTLNRQRLALAILLCALLPVAVELPALAALVLLALLLCGLIAYEAVRFAAARDRIRHTLYEMD